MNDFTKFPCAGHVVAKKDGPAGLKSANVSDSTIRRLSLYLRLLREVEGMGQETISSVELAERAGTTAAQVRKDLSVFGSFGKRGLGYDASELRRELREILGLNRTWRVALVGAGKIGSALITYSNFQRRGFHIEAVFDVDPVKIGSRLGDREVLDDAGLERVLVEEEIDIVVVAVPASAAQKVVDRVTEAGVQAVLNFAPARVRVPEGVALRNVDMVLELEGLAFALANG